MPLRSVLSAASWMRSGVAAGDRWSLRRLLDQVMPRGKSSVQSMRRNSSSPWRWRRHSSSSWRPPTSSTLPRSSSAACWPLLSPDISCATCSPALSWPPLACWSARSRCSNLPNHSDNPSGQGSSPSGYPLRDSHILLSHSNSITRGHCGQLVPASPHGLRTCWLIVAIPSAEAGNDPGKPSERAWFMTVLLARGVSFERRADSFGGGDEAVIGDIGCRPRAAIPGVDELDCARCGHKSDSGDLEQPSRLRDLSFLQAQPVALHRAEHLFDPPAQPIEAHDLLGGGEFVRFSRHRQGGEQSPSDRSLALWRLDLAHLEIGEGHRLGIDRGSMSRFDDAYASRLHSHLGETSSSAGSRWRDADIHGAEVAPIGRRIEQTLAVGKPTIVRGTHDQMHSRRNSDELRIDIELPVAQHDQLRSGAQKIAGRRRRLDPSKGFLVFDLSRPARHHRLGRPRPDACVHDPEQRFIIEIDRNHRMAEKARRFPVTRWPETFSPAMTTFEVDLGGVLRRHNSSSGTSRGRSSSDGLEDLLGRHMRRTQKAMGRKLSGPIAADP